MRLTIKDYTIEKFHKEYTSGTGPGKLKAVGKLCQLLGLTPGEDTAVRICKSYELTPRSKLHNIEFEIDMKKLTGPNRRALKSFVELEVPSYAQGGTYESPPLYGKIEFRQPRVNDHYDLVDLNFQVNGAYVCKAVSKTIK